MKPLTKEIISFILIPCMLACFSNVHAQTKSISIDSSSKENFVCSQVETEAAFPGGPAAWSKYLSKAISDNSGSLKKSDYGTCIIRFIVNTKGRVSDVEATTMKKSRLAKIAIEAIENGPKWIPAQQNGKYVNAYRLQPVTVTRP